MSKLLYKKECSDCPINAENEVLDDILSQLRVIIGVPDKADILDYARKTIKKEGDE